MSQFPGSFAATFPTETMPDMFFYVQIYVEH